jgi:ATP-dependent Clp protease adaptor protein ClpS
MLPVTILNLTLDLCLGHIIFASTRIPALGGQPDDDGEQGFATIIREKIKRPKRYKVFLHNDDYSTMEFVIFVLQTVFGKNSLEAQAIMMKVHMEGAAVCGIYSYEVAESKTNKVAQLAKEHGHPLKCTMEEE